VSLPPNQISQGHVRPHPHIGPSIVSYRFGGQITHRNSPWASRLPACPASAP
jgi:redox-sensitive bicupin YhaK (pirin superfamily)